MAKEAKRIEEILARSKATEVCAVNTNGTQDQIDSLRGEIRDLKVMLENKVSATQTNVVTQGSRRCFGCDSTAHLLRDCDRRPPTRGRGGSLHGRYRVPTHGRGRASLPSQSTITCYNCGGRGHRKVDCSSPHLN